MKFNSQPCAAYNQQYDAQSLCAMPTNLYRPGDNDDLNTSHVLPALMRKTLTAKNKSQPRMTACSTGTPRREFLHRDDPGDACATLLDLPPLARFPPLKKEGGGRITRSPYSGIAKTNAAIDKCGLRRRSDHTRTRRSDRGCGTIHRRN